MCAWSGFRKTEAGHELPNPAGRKPFPFQLFPGLGFPGGVGGDPERGPHAPPLSSVLLLSRDQKAPEESLSRSRLEPDRTRCFVFTVFIYTFAF